MAIGNEPKYCIKVVSNNGNKVIVDRIGKYVVVEVIDTGFFTKYDAPYPIEKTKEIEEFVTEKTDFSNYGINENIIICKDEKNSSK